MPTLSRRTPFAPLHPLARDKRAGPPPPPVREEPDIYAPPKSSSDEEDGITAMRSDDDKDVLSQARPSKKRRVNPTVHVPRDGHWKTRKLVDEQSRTKPSKEQKPLESDDESKLVMSSGQRRTRAGYGKSSSKQNIHTKANDSADTDDEEADILASDPNSARRFKPPKGRKLAVEGYAAGKPSAEFKDPTGRCDELSDRVYTKAKPIFKERPAESLPKAGKRASFRAPKATAERLPSKFKDPPSALPGVRPEFRSRPNPRLSTVAGIIAPTSVNAEADLSSPHSTASISASSPRSSFDAICSSTSTVSPVRLKPQASVSSPKTPVSATCPLCSAPVHPAQLSDLDDLLPTLPPQKRFSHQELFCLTHREADARAARARLGYPEINWTNFSRRLSRYDNFIASLLRGESPSWYRQRLQTRQLARKKSRAGREGVAEEMARDADGGEEVGYYGSKGARAIMEHVIRNFAGLLREKRSDPVIVAVGGTTAYLQAVLVPEVAVRLVVEDKMQAELEGEEDDDDGGTGDSDPGRVLGEGYDGRAFTEEEETKARKTLRETAWLGRLLCVEDDDEVSGENEEVEAGRSGGKIR